MIKFEVCKKVLNQKEKKFTDEQVRKIRDLLYQIAEIEFLNFKTTKNHEKKCNPVRENFKTRTNKE